MTKPSNPPETSFEFICEWFEKARKNALAQGRNDSAKLWEDGLQHLKYYHSQYMLLKAREEVSDG
jgi:hypothetical protein